MAMDAARMHSERRPVTSGPVARGPERAPLGSGQPDDAGLLEAVGRGWRGLMEDLRG